MIRIVRPLGVLAVLLTVLGAACATGTHPPPQYAYDHKADFASFKTFAWYADPTFKMPHGDSIVDGQFIDQHVRQAIDTDLEKKGYQKVAADVATMLVAYHTGDSGVASHDEYGDYEWWTGYNLGTVYEKERSIVIDVRNSSKKLVWRGQITRLEGENPNAVASSLDHDISTLLGHFPPSP